jgi:FXSXX-COOH protein
MNKALREQLAALHRELGTTAALDAESRKLLATLSSDINRLLQQPSTSPAERGSLTSRLDQLAVRFEADHPALGTALRRVVDTLANAGI